MAVAGVVGMAVGLRGGVPAIRVFVRDAAARDQVPERIDGYEVSVEVTGDFTAR